MNYYRRFPGDYARDTKHLSLLEHGAYCLLLDVLYSTEKPLPKNLPILFRICGASTKRERNAVKSVLSEFFFRKPTGFSNKKFENELSHSELRIKAAQENGKLGGRPRKNEPTRNPEPNPQKSSPEPVPDKEQIQNLARLTPRSSPQPVENGKSKSQTRFKSIAKLANKAIEISSHGPISQGDLTEELKTWAATNGIEYFDALPGVASPIEQALTIAEQRQKAVV